MRILIDECLNWRLSRALTGHYSISVQRLGWSGLKNGELLALAEKEFDVFLTGDRNLSLQQNFVQYDIAIIVLHAASTQLHHTLPLMEEVLALMPALKRGSVVDIYPEGDRP